MGDTPETPEDEIEVKQVDEMELPGEEGLDIDGEENNKELGRHGERVAAYFLRRQDYEILERNWVCRYGEADIIARDEDGTLVFVEVKTRRTIETGLPEEAVNAQKQSRYERIAMSYLMLHDEEEYQVRFDVIAICVTRKDRAFLRHHIGCFDRSCVA